jgi:hydroxymethylglutaryl-CoA lyase
MDVVTVTVRDVTLRDGLQDERPIATADKIRLLEAIVAAGVRDIELTSFVRADRVPAMADATDLVAAAHEKIDITQVRLSALVPNRRGALDALAAGIQHLVFVVSVSDRHNRGNVGLSTDESLRALASVVATAGAEADVEVVLATALGCPYTGPVPAADGIRRARQSADAGVIGVSIADTIGTGVPSEVRALVSAVIAETRLPVGAHLHDTRGLGVANALAAIDGGATRIDGAVGGLGGCPFAPGASGNLALEDLVDCLDGMSIPTGVDPARLVDAASLACSLVGQPVTSHVAVAGPRHRRLAPS